MSIGSDERVRLEWLILADAAQVSNGKLHLLGGGWDVLTVNSGFPFHQHVAMCVAYRVPWVETNQRHTFEVAIVNEDTQEKLVAVAGEFETGRPPGLPAGSSQLSQLAGEANIEFGGPGLFTLRASVNGEDCGRYPFRVIEGPVLQMKRGVKVGE